MIEGNSEIVSLLPVRWQAYQKELNSQATDIIIILKEGLDFKNDVVHDGWMLFTSENLPKMIYFLGNQAIFSMQSCVYDNMLMICVKKPFDHYIRSGIQFGILTLLCHKCVGLHGVTLLCRNEIVILSAPSGTGKTTLAHLLEQYCDGLVINGDFALLTCSDEGVIFEPTPFCGTSQRCINRRVRVNRIVFLEQAEINEWKEATGRQAMIRFMSNSFIPTWDMDLQHSVETTISKCVSFLNINIFSFYPTQEAAEVFFDKLT